jgi:hypothetical protein
MIDFQLQFISAIIILASSAVPIYLTIKLKDNLKKLTLILTVFILIHAVYHVFGFLEVWSRWKVLARTILTIPKFKSVWAKTKDIHNSEFRDFIDDGREREQRNRTR